MAFVSSSDSVVSSPCSAGASGVISVELIALWLQPARVKRSSEGDKVRVFIVDSGSGFRAYNDGHWALLTVPKKFFY